MNAPEMVLQGKSWRNREQPPPKINSRHATFVRRNWPWRYAVDQNVRVPVTNDFGLPESRVMLRQKQARLARDLPPPGRSFPCPCAVHCPMLAWAVAQPQALAWAQSLVPHSWRGSRGEGPPHCGSALSTGGDCREDWNVLKVGCVCQTDYRRVWGATRIFFTPDI